jgi:hypothetical protein
VDVLVWDAVVVVVGSGVLEEVGRGLAVVVAGRAMARMFSRRVRRVDVVWVMRAGKGRC